MLQLELIQGFLQNQKIAVVGVSRKGDIPANEIFKRLNANGYKVFPVNPNASEVEGKTCYPAIKDIPEKPDAVMLASTPEVSDQVIDECGEMGIKWAWMHHGMGKGSYSKTAVDKAKSLGINLVHNGCPMMFVGSVDPFHKFFRWLKKF
jgi:hypothetical protein